MKLIFLAAALLIVSTSYGQSVRKTAAMLDGTKCKVTNKNPYRAAFATIRKGQIIFAARNRQPVMVFNMSAVDGKTQVYGRAHMAPRGHRYVEMTTGLFGTRASFSQNYNKRFKSLRHRVGKTLNLKCDPFVPVLRRISGTKCKIAQNNWNNPYGARYMVLKGSNAIFLNKNKMPVMQFSIFTHKGIVNMFGKATLTPSHIKYSKYAHFKAGLGGTKVTFSNSFSRKKFKIGNSVYSMKMKCKYPKQ